MAPTPKLDLDALYRRYGPMVHRRCRQLLRDEQAAMDATQDTFVNLVRHASRLHGTAPSALLNRIATHVCLNRLRGRPREHAPIDEALEVIARVEDTETRTLAQRILDRIFDREPSTTRTIAVLHFVDGLTLAEVAAEVGLSLSGVRKRLRVFQSRLGETALVTPPEVL